MPRTQVAARLISNSRWNLIAFGFSVVGNFVSLPIAISAVGIDAFGAAGLVLALYAPFTLVGTVIGQALIPELAPRLRDKDFAGASRTASAAFALAAFGCLVAVALLWLGGAIYEGYRPSRLASSMDWSDAMLLCGLGWAAQQGCLVLQSALVAAQQYGRLALVGSMAAVSSAAAIVLAARAMPNAMGFLLGTAIGFAITLLLLLLLLRRDMSWLLQFRRWRREDMAALLGFGKWQGAAHFAGAVGNQIDRYVLGAMTPLAVVGQYNVAMRLQEVVHMGVLKMSEVLFPHFSVTASDPLEKRASFFVRASWVLNVISVAALAPLIPTATSLITLWVDPATAVIGAPILRTLASAGVIGSGVNVYIYFAMASGQTPRIALITFTHSLMLITFTVLLILQFGALAAGAGYVVANLVRLMIVTRFSSDYFSPALPPATVLKYTLPPLVGGLLCAWLPVGAQLPPATGWLTLALAYVLAAATICVAALLATALTRAGRILIRETYTAGRQILLNRH